MFIHIRKNCFSDASSSFSKITRPEFPLESISHIVMIPPYLLFSKLFLLGNEVTFYKSDVQGYFSFFEIFAYFNKLLFLMVLSLF